MQLKLITNVKSNYHVLKLHELKVRQLISRGPPKAFRGKLTVGDPKFRLN